MLFERMDRVLVHISWPSGIILLLSNFLLPVGCGVAAIIFLIAHDTILSSSERSAASGACGDLGWDRQRVAVFGQGPERDRVPRVLRHSRRPAGSSMRCAGARVAGPACGDAACRAKDMKAVSAGPVQSRRRLTAASAQEEEPSLPPGPRTILYFAEGKTDQLHRAARGSGRRRERAERGQATRRWPRARLEAEARGTAPGRRRGPRRRAPVRQARPRRRGKTPIVAAVETTAERGEAARLSVSRASAEGGGATGRSDFAAWSNVASDGLSCGPAVEWPAASTSRRRPAGERRRAGRVQAGSRPAWATSKLRSPAYYDVSAKHMKSNSPASLTASIRPFQLYSIVERLAGPRRTARSPIGLLSRNA